MLRDHDPVCDSLTSARLRLGGRSAGPSAVAPGTLVEAVLRDGTFHAGVLLWAAPRYWDVWFDDGLARRTRAEALSLRRTPTPETLARIAADVCLFSAMTEGDRVCWERALGVVEGRLVEKCRYGAIVAALDDRECGRLVAVGFRKLWPGVIRANA